VGFMDFFFISYRDPLSGILLLVLLVFIIAVMNFFWRLIKNNREEKGVSNFISKFKLTSESSLPNLELLSFNDLKFLASVFTKSGEFEKAIRIYLFLLEKIRGKISQEKIFESLAKIYLKAGFLQKSEESLINCLKIRPRNENALSLLKIVYLKLKNYQKALEALEALSELKENLELEEKYLKLKLIEASQMSADQKLENSLKVLNDEPLLKRFIYENYASLLFVEFDYFIDLASAFKQAVFLEDENYLELFYALKLCKEAPKSFKNKRLLMLEILLKNDFKAALSFSYLCKKCKNIMPLFFYHCPICYKFGTCKISYEVKACEKN